MHQHRLGYFDNLKILMIIFVVIMHAAVTYSGSGRWYYNEASVFGDFSYYIFSFYQTFTQAYSMSLLFMVGGYFTVPSLEKKGSKAFLLDRILRLGLPTVIFIFLLHPLCVVLVSPEYKTNFFGHYWDGIASLKFFGWTGPLWFAEALLVFSVAYVFVQNGLNRLNSIFSFSVSAKNLSLLVLCIAVGASVLRYFFPIGTAIMNLQFGYFSAYIFMFLVGTLAYKKNLFKQMTYHRAKKFFSISLFVGVLPWVYMIYRGERDIPFLKVWPGSFLFSLWESFVCVITIFALIGIFKEKFNTQNWWQKFLSANAFAVYCFHAPVLVATSLVLKDLVLPTLLKFVIVSILTILASVLVSYFIRRSNLLRKVFS